MGMYSWLGWLELIVDDTEVPTFAMESDGNDQSIDQVTCGLGKLLVSGKNRMAGGVWHQLHEAADAGDAAQVAKLIETGGTKRQDSTACSAHPSIQQEEVRAERKSMNLFPLHSTQATSKELLESVLFAIFSVLPSQASTA